MTTIPLAVLMVAALGVAALTGPWVLRRAAPGLVRFPRAAVSLLSTGVVAWVLAALAVGPLLAWSLSGPVLLPDGAADVCRRCLAAASPFPGGPVDTGVPALALLLLPALGSVALAALIAREARRRRRATLRTAQQLRDSAEPRRVLGHRVLVTEHRRPFAMALRKGHGGIIVSSGALQRLSADELAAVLAHEQAHLRQRHHLVTDAVAGISRPLRWVPFIAAAQSGLEQYVEIAADDAARRRTGTSALAGALLALGEAEHRDRQGAPVEGVLHAAGPHRIRHLVLPPAGSAGVLPALAASAGSAGLALLAAVVHVPYLVAVLTGCG